MTDHRPYAFVNLLLLLPVALVACGKLNFGRSSPGTTTTKVADIAGYTALKDLASAPDAIRTAADAVVKITSEFDGSSGTGSFISADGLLLTNNHVMGSGLCAADGCYFTIHQNYQVGHPYQDKLTVFGKPQFASVELDAAILQVYRTDAGGAVGDKLATPSFLEFEPIASAELIGVTTYIVGHPNGALKKWSVGQGERADGAWFYATNFALGGNSGSPVLNDAGKIVGLLHRGPGRAESITAHDLQTYAINTSSKALLDAYKPGSAAALKLGLFLASGKAGADPAPTDAQLSARPAVFYNAHVGVLTAKDGTKRQLATVLGAACDVALKQPPAATLEDFSANLQVCSDAVAFLGCHGDQFLSCPADADKALWLARFDLLATQVQAFHGATPYYWLTTAPAALERTSELGYAAAAQHLAANLTAHQPPLDLILAYRMAANPADNAAPVYAGVNVIDYVRNYTAIPDYAYDGAYVAYAASWLASHKLLTVGELGGLYHQLLADPSLTLPDHLTIERSAYDWGVL